ncbi:Uncharacterised protein [Vibrio cholerae]|uniref:Uncharacterized protein n=1 Tax=Vibrio cholerae TaxID=666 RepID=A0A655TEI6_VIBCL|nr:Uncharacterised protein [Vibrio cholerae]CSA83690.1 Uncharacterised protein [Vibrio cholerae]CSB17021.1 Uncharacterised protein [Vibrio cholerae]CSB34934.1 Uncharacterised protein [Vibrio cholerae]CSB60618.1 Uncharacterised protein [Vibrio cholerae]
MWLNLLRAPLIDIIQNEISDRIEIINVHLRQIRCDRLIGSNRNDVFIMRVKPRLTDFRAVQFNFWKSDIFTAFNQNHIELFSIKSSQQIIKLRFGIGGFGH